MGSLILGPPLSHVIHVEIDILDHGNASGKLTVCLRDVLTGNPDYIFRERSELPGKSHKAQAC